MTGGGKERCSRVNLEKYLRDETGPVSRLTLFLYPESESPAYPAADLNAYHRIQVIRSRRGLKADISEIAATLATKHGVEILCEAKDGNRQCYVYQQPSKECSPKAKHLSATLHECAPGAWLQIQAAGIPERFMVKDFNIEMLMEGRRFMANRIPETETALEKSGRLWSFTASLHDRPKGTVRLQAEDNVVGALLLSPARIHGRRCFVLHRALKCRSGKHERKMS